MNNWKYYFSISSTDCVELGFNVCFYPELNIWLVLPFVSIYFEFKYLKVLKQVFDKHGRKRIWKGMYNAKSLYKLLKPNHYLYNQHYAPTIPIYRIIDINKNEAHIEHYLVNEGNENKYETLSLDKLARKLMQSNTCEDWFVCQKNLDNQ